MFRGRKGLGEKEKLQQVREQRSYGECKGFCSSKGLDTPDKRCPQTLGTVHYRNLIANTTLLREDLHFVVQNKLLPRSSASEFQNQY